MNILYTLTVIVFVYSSGLCQFSPAQSIDTDRDRQISLISLRSALSLPPDFLLSQPLHLQQLEQVIDTLLLSSKLLSADSQTLTFYKQRLSTNHCIVSYRNAEQQIFSAVNMNFWGAIQPTRGNDSLRINLKGTLNPSYCGSFKRWSFFTEFSAWTEYDSDTLYKQSDYQPFKGNPYNLYGRKDSSSVRSSDIVRGGVSYCGADFELETAVDYLRQGPAFFYPLTLSGKTNPITYARVTIPLAIVTYTHTLGLLQMQKYKDKHLYTHRVSFSLFDDRMHLGISEVIIGGTRADKAQKDALPKNFTSEIRGWEWAYMIPFVPFKFTEHYIGDKDNAALSCDASVLFLKQGKLYGEFFLDDMTSPWSLFSTDFGNKWAVTIGLQYAYRVGSYPVGLTAEYSRVEPWVYTHFYGASHNYAHFGACLGSPSGPNSAALKLLGECTLHNTCRIGLFFENTRNNPSQRGGSIEQVFQTKETQNSPTDFLDSKNKQFLGAGYTTKSTAGVRIDYLPSALFMLRSTFTFDFFQELALSIEGGFSF